MAAAEIFRSTSVPEGYTAYDLGWNEQDTPNSARNLIVPMTETFLHTNWRYLNQHSYPLIGAIAGYIFTENRDRYSEAVEWYTVNASTSRPEQNGSIAALFPLISAEIPSTRTATLSSSTRRWAATRPTPGTASTPTERWPGS